ncbi:Hypothetical protein SMAX5B_000059 [Scophthalmus maximus]|uniref:Uncharacterized protein n=1 Tax=Scophthalmus maximus TaxID=52904 RepID=A0A2U9CXI2_SCOMX|nr:Hypothetical protein SMAX5B_000059 [Scophthalmus maximus]
MQHYPDVERISTQGQHSTRQTPPVSHDVREPLCFSDTVSIPLSASSYPSYSSTHRARVLRERNGTKLIARRCTVPVGVSPINYAREWFLSDC